MDIKLNYTDSLIEIDTRQNGELVISINSEASKYILPQVMNSLSYLEFIQAIGEEEFEAMIYYYDTEYKEDK
jgi:hypothetical protein